MALAKGKQVLREAWTEGFKPDPLLTVSAWSQKYRYLSTKASAEPGLWRNSRTPYLVSIMDSLSPSSSCEKVVFMKGAQIGGTECLNNFVGACIDNFPGPFLLVNPTQDMAKRNSKTRIAPLIEECPQLRSKVREAKSRDSGNSILQKEFLGGILVMVGANSASGLRSMPAKYLGLDECDAYPGDLEGEGCPCQLAEARTRTFSKRKIFYCSTPTFAGRSRIEREYLESNMSLYYVPCPNCGEYIPIEWESLRWDKNLEWVKCACPECGELFDEHHKAKILGEGKWIARNPESKVHGYQLSSLYSPLGWFSWTQAVKMHLNAKSDEEKKVFTNTVLGRTFADAADVPDWEELYNRRENYQIGTIPDKKIAVLVAGADVQKDRIEMEVVGFCPNMESYSIDHQVIYGNTAEDEVWGELSKRIRYIYPTSCDGKDMAIRMVAIDSGFRTQEVYRWVRGENQSQVICIKGRETQSTVIGPSSSVDVTRRGKTWKAGVRVWPVGTSVTKSELYGWLKRKKPLDEDDELPFGWAHFPEWPEEYFKQLCAEQLVTRVVRGYQKFQWEKIRARNEILDLRVYARSCVTALGCDRWDEKRWLKESSKVNPITEKKAPSSEKGLKRRRGSFLKR